MVPQEQPVGTHIEQPLPEGWGSARYSVARRLASLRHAGCSPRRGPPHADPRRPCETDPVHRAETAVGSTVTRTRTRTIRGIRRAVPDHTSGDLGRSQAFYGEFLGFKIGMDMGWIVNFVSPDNPAAQVIVMTEDQTAGVTPDLTIEVDDVDRLHAQALELGYHIVHPLTDEPWGVRRFFVRDPDGKVVNVMSHLARHDEPAAT